MKKDPNFSPVFIFARDQRVANFAKVFYNKADAGLFITQQIHRDWHIEQEFWYTNQNNNTDVSRWVVYYKDSGGRHCIGVSTESEDGALESVFDDAVEKGIDVVCEDYNIDMIELSKIHENEVAVEVYNAHGFMEE